MSVHPDVEQMLRKAITAHAEIYDLLGQIRKSVNAELECEELADIAIFCREAESHLDDMRKEVKKTKELCEKLCCLRYLEDATRMMKKEPIRTEYQTASPEMSTFARIPTIEKDPEGYTKLMTYLGIDRQLWDYGEILTENGKEHTEVVKVNWPGFMALLTRLKAEGLPLPDGIDPNATYVEYKLRMKKKGELIKSATTNDSNVSNASDDIPF